MLRDSNRRQQPRRHKTVDRSNPLTRGLAYCFYPSTQNIPSNSAGDEQTATIVGSGLTIRPKPFGNCFTPAAASSAVEWDNKDAITGALTMFCLIGAENATTTGPVISISKGGTGYIQLGMYSTFAGTEYPIFAHDGGSISNNTLQLRGKWRFCVGVSRSNTDHELFVDGVSIGTSSTTSDTFDSTCKVAVGRYVEQGFAVQYLSTNANVALAGIYNRALSNSEIIELTKNPWQLFAPTKRSFVWQAISGGTSLSTSIGRVNYTGALPTLAIGVTLALGAGLITFTGSAPTLSTGSQQTLSTGIGRINYTGAQPTIVATGGAQSVSTGIGNIDFTGIQPTIAVRVNLSVYPALYLITGYQPTLETVAEWGWSQVSSASSTWVEVSDASSLWTEIPKETASSGV